MMNEEDKKEEETNESEANGGRGFKGGGGNPNRIYQIFVLFLLLFINTFQIASSIKNEFLPISSICQRSHKSFLSTIPRPIDGAVIESHNERDIDCVVTFQTESILERFMLRFEDLKIDCNDHLYIFDGAHAIGNYRASISCDKTKDSVGSGGVIFTRTNFVTLKYVTDSWGMDRNGFKLVITAFKDGEKNGCRNGFQCDAHLCINKDLVCDNVNHCGNAEDERSSQFCNRIGFLPPFMDLASTIAILLAVVLLLVAGAVAIWITVCRKNRDRQAQAAASTADLRRANSFQMSSSAAQVKGVNGVSAGTVITTTPLPLPPPPTMTTRTMPSTLRGSSGGLNGNSNAAATTTTTSLSGNGNPPAVVRGYIINFIIKCFNHPIIRQILIPRSLIP